MTMLLPGLLLESQNGAVTYFVLVTSVVMPIVVLGLVVFFFVRSARRNDEREAREAREAAGRRP
jgi:hypothetical protein